MSAPVGLVCLNLKDNYTLLYWSMCGVEMFIVSYKTHSQFWLELFSIVRALTGGKDR